MPVPGSESYWSECAWGIQGSMVTPVVTAAVGWNGCHGRDSDPSALSFPSGTNPARILPTEDRGGRCQPYFTRTRQNRLGRRSV